MSTPYIASWWNVADAQNSLHDQLVFPTEVVMTGVIGGTRVEHVGWDLLIIKLSGEDRT